MVHAQAAPSQDNPSNFTTVHLSPVVENNRIQITCPNIKQSMWLVIQLPPQNGKESNITYSDFTFPNVATCSDGQIIMFTPLPGIGSDGINTTIPLKEIGSFIDFNGASIGNFMVNPVWDNESGNIVTMKLDKPNKKWYTISK